MTLINFNKKINTEYYIIQYAVMNIYQIEK
jgi:hypothetical protein